MKVEVLMFWLCITLINLTQFIRTEHLQEWEDFKMQYVKHYATPKEEKRRLKIFKKNIRRIAKHNEKFRKGKVTFTMGINQFTDLTAKEFAIMYLPNITLSHPLNRMARTQKSGSIVTYLDSNLGTPPDFKDWVAEGAVTPVKHQGWTCGSCWAFATAGAIESHNFIQTGRMVSLSEQNLLDCVGTVDTGTWKWTNNCSGGFIDFSLQYVIDNRGIDTEESYPYEGQQRQCRYRSENRGAKIRDFMESENGNEELLRDIVGLIGPVTSVFFADHNFMQLYQNGIFKSATCGKPGTDYTAHAVLVVGYGTEENEPYWLVKNSWGPGWGENGYFRIRRGTNECDMASGNYYPVI